MKILRRERQIEKGGEKRRRADGERGRGIMTD